MKRSLYCLMAATSIFGGATVSARAQKAHPASLPLVARPLEGPIRLRFINTDVSDVLQAISVQTHANIVFPSQLKKPISINITAESTKVALSFVSAAAGLAFRQIGPTYIVAQPADLRLALEPFGEQVHAPLKVLTSDQAGKLVTSAFPYLTVRPGGNQLILIGAPEDITQAQNLLVEQDRLLQSSDPISSELATVQFVSTAQLASMVKSLYPEVKAEPVGPGDKPGGIIGLIGPRSQVDGAKDVIHRADLPVGPAEPTTEYRVYPIRYSSAPVLESFMIKAAPKVITMIGPDNYSPPAAPFNPLSGASLSSSSGGGGSGGGGSAGGSSGGGGGTASGGGGTAAGGGGTASGGGGHTASESRSKFLVLRGTSEDLDSAFKLLAEVDLAPKQLMIEVKVLDTSPEQAENLGLEFSYSPLGLFELPAGSPPGNISAATRPKQLGYFSRLPLGVSAQLSALITHKEAKLLANPRVQVLDNDDANIFIGDTIRTQVSQASISGTTVTVLEFPVGIVLLVRPRINADGKITMRVHPVVSTVTGISSTNLPQTSSREAETTVMISDGETIVIGGLIKDEMTKVIDEVPFLSKIPIIGQLFRNRSTDHTHSDIMVFITAHIVK